MKELVLSVDYSQKWPLSDIVWEEQDQPQWEEILSEGLRARLVEWAAFFNEHADWETASFGGEPNRRWFDLQGFKLLDELTSEAGHLFDFQLRLWF